MNSKRTLGFIGLGVMGGPMSTNLVTRSGHDMFAFDLDVESLDRVESAGATRCSSVVDVAEKSDIVFLSLPSIVQVEAVAAELSTASNPPAVIVDMSTSDVTRTKALAETLTAANIELVDAPVARLRQAAKDGTLLITVGATEERFADLKPLLSCMGSDIVHAGETGSGQVIKILNNMVVFQNMNALAEARAIGVAAGVDPKVLFETLTLGSSDSFILRKSALATLAVDNFPLKTFPTVYAIKDLALALQLARDEDVPTASADETMKLLEATRDAGYADEYYPVMVKLIEKGSRK